MKEFWGCLQFYTQIRQGASWITSLKLDNSEEEIEEESRINKELTNKYKILCEDSLSKKNIYIIFNDYILKIRIYGLLPIKIIYSSSYISFICS
jgi:hypothetical protein